MTSAKMAKFKPKFPFAGRWHIVSMDEWDVDYMEEGPAFIEFGADQMGEFRFGLTSGNIDYRITERGGQPAADWTWEGMDEMDPCTGRGWAVLEGLGRSSLLEPPILNRRCQWSIPSGRRATGATGPGHELRDGRRHGVLLAVRGLVAPHPPQPLLAGLAKGFAPPPVSAAPRPRGGVDRVRAVGDPPPRGRADAGVDRHERNAPRLQRRAVDRHLPLDGAAV